MSECAYTIFDSPIGRCALLWRGGLIVGASLPASSDEALRRSLERRFAGSTEAEPPAAIAAAVAALVRLLSGQAEDLRHVEIDLAGLPDFQRDVLELTRAIPAGETRTYGEIAASLGSPGAARAVGRALGANPIPIVIPCHRVLAAGGRSGGFSAPGGASTKLRILEIERARRGGDAGLFEHLPLAISPTARPGGRR